ncbi:MAG: hypothetical protein MPJ24_02965 [Pirellulaceae bacterium]|nr:hypothetical protein [Pirellulaceae bacterium]
MNKISCEQFNERIHYLLDSRNPAEKVNLSKGSSHEEYSLAPPSFKEPIFDDQPLSADPILQQHSFNCSECQETLFLYSHLFDDLLNTELSHSRTTLTNPSPSTPEFNHKVLKQLSLSNGIDSLNTDSQHIPSYSPHTLRSQSTLWQELSWKEVATILTSLAAIFLVALLPFWSHQDEGRKLAQKMSPVRNSASENSSTTDEAKPSSPWQGYVMNSLPVVTENFSLDNPHIQKPVANIASTLRPVASPFGSAFGYIFKPFRGKIDKKIKPVEKNDHSYFYQLNFSNQRIV